MLKEHVMGSIRPPHTLVQIRRPQSVMTIDRLSGFVDARMREQEAVLKLTGLTGRMEWLFEAGNRRRFI